MENKEVLDDILKTFKKQINDEFKDIENCDEKVATIAESILTRLNVLESIIKELNVKDLEKMPFEEYVQSYINLAYLINGVLYDLIAISKDPNTKKGTQIVIDRNNSLINELKPMLID